MRRVIRFTYNILNHFFLISGETKIIQKVKRLKKKKVKRYNNCYLLKTWQMLFKSSLTIIVSIFPQSTLITTLANRLKSDDRLPLIQASWHRVNQLSYGGGGKRFFVPDVAMFSRNSTGKCIRTAMKLFTHYPLSSITAQLTCNSLSIVVPKHAW